MKNEEFLEELKVEPVGEKIQIKLVTIWNKNEQQQQQKQQQQQDAKNADL